MPTVLARAHHRRRLAKARETREAAACALDAARRRGDTRDVHKFIKALRDETTRVLALERKAGVI